jgi:hypothetical protein
MQCRDDKSSSNASSDVSRPSSSHSQMHLHPRIGRPRSFQSYANDLGGQYRPSSSSSHRSSQLHSARSMTSMSQYHSRRSPSPAFYAAHEHYDSSRDYDQDLHYPVEPLQCPLEHPYLHRTIEEECLRPNIVSNTTHGVRQTPSPLRWAMQDLMESLDTMTPQLRPGPPSSPESASLSSRYTPNGIRHEHLDKQIKENWGSEDYNHKIHYDDVAEDIGPQYTYPFHMRPPPLLNYVDKMQSKLERLHNYRLEQDQTAPAKECDNRSPSRISNGSVVRPGSAYSVDKSLPASPSIFPPKPPPHSSRHRDSESVTSHSTKYSIFSSNGSEYSSATSAGSNISAGSAGSFTMRKVRQQTQEEENVQQRRALGVLSKTSSNNGNSMNGLLRRRKSYGASLKKTIGKLLNPSPSKPTPGSVTDHGGKIIEWQNARRDVNRANTPSAQELSQYREQLELGEGIQVIRPFEILQRIIEGDASANGNPILPDESFEISSNRYSLR